MPAKTTSSSVPPPPPPPPPPLPPNASAQAALDASRATVALFIRAGSTDIPIRELAGNAGISERSFYRYFPRKEDSVRPFLLAGQQRVVANFAARPASESVRASLEVVGLDSWPVREPKKAQVLHRLLAADGGFRAMLLQTVVECEVGWAEAIARRLGIPPDSSQAIFAGAVVCTAFRLAWRSCSGDPRLDPATALVTNLHMLDAPMFAPEPTLTPAARTRGARPVHTAKETT